MNKKTIFSLLVICFFSLALMVPLFTVFAAGGLVPCDGVVQDSQGHWVSDCDFDKLLLLALNIMNFLITVSISLSAITFAYAGYVFLTANGSSSKIEKAKGIFWKVLIGFLFVLGAWLIVRTITSAILCSTTSSNPSANCGYFDLLAPTNP